MKWLFNIRAVLSEGAADNFRAPRNEYLIRSPDTHEISASPKNTKIPIARDVCTKVLLLICKKCKCKPKKPDANLDKVAWVQQ